MIQNNAKEWDIFRLDEIISLEYGEGLPEEKRIRGDFPVVGSNGIVGYHKDAFVKGPGIVIGRKGTIGAVSWINKDFWPIDTTYYVKTKRNDVYLKWLFYELKYLNLSKLTLSDVVPGLNREIAYSMKLPLPKFQEQQRIAEILETTDKTIDKTKHLIDKYKKIKQGLMHDLFSKERLNSIEFSQIIDKIMDFRGKTPKKLGMEWGKGDILALSANNVKMGYIDPNAEAYYASEKLYGKWMNKGKPERGDILLTMEAPLGNVAQIPDDRKYVLSQRVVLIRPKKEKIENEYLAHFLRSDFFQKQLLEFSSGTTATGIQQAKLIKLTILRPESKEEQEEIAITLTMIDNTIDSQELCLSKLIKVKAGLMRDLLTGKVRVAA